MNIAEQYINDFYETHDKHTSIKFNDMMKTLNIDSDTLRAMLIPLIRSGVLKVTLNADNVPFMFCLK